MSEYDLVVIGGGSAGLVAAVGAAKLGARVALVERRALGGDCLYTGCVPSKALIRSARFAWEAGRAGEFGFEPRPARFAGGSFASVTERVRRVIEVVEAHDAPEVFRREGVEVVFAEPRFVSPHELLLEEVRETGTRDGAHETKTNTPPTPGERRTLRSRRFCVATGSRPAVPPVEGLAEAGFVTNEQVFNLRELPRALVVLGGGAVGLELGQAFARFGSEVTIVEMGERLLPKEDEEVSAFLAAVLREEGLRVLTSAKVVRAARAGGRKRVTVEQGGARLEVDADEILVAAGREANVAGLNLEAAGVGYDGRRIHTDDYLRTSAPSVYAAGDVTGHFQFTHTAAYEAALVVRNALFFWPLRQKADFRVVPWATFTAPEAARVGLTEREARERFGAGVRVYRSGFAENDRAQAEGATRGFVKLVCAGRGEKIVGASIVGAHAGELIHEVVLAMKRRLGVAALGGLIHVYPTLTQVTQKAALDAVLAKLSAPLARALLARYFGRRR